MSQGSTTTPSVGVNNTTAPTRTTQVGGVDASGNLQANTIKPLNVQVAGTDQGIVTNSVIHGLTTAGGGTYVDVKVTPSGALSVATTLNDGTDTALVTAAGELNVLATAQPGVDIGDVTINNAAGASAVNIQDGGNSITVDGSVSISGTPTISGTVTANAGTNLNTSLLALESGGNLATAATNTTGLNNTVGTAASAIPSKLLQIGGSDGTNARAVKVNTSGQMDIRPLTASDVVAVTDNAGSLTVDAPVATPVFVRLSDGAAAISALPVTDNNSSLTVDYATTGSGTATGALRVELPTNGTGVVGLNAGAAIIGKVGIDQTTPGTTNLVALSAETTKAIGVVRNSDGAGNLLTSNSTTYTAKAGLDSNLLGTLGTAFSTAGKVDVKGADGDVFVRQATGTNLHTVVDSITPPTLTKATQGATGFSVQDLKDAGRTSIMITATVASTATAETLITITRSQGLAATGTSTSTTITSGKRLRIQSIVASARNSTGTTAGVATIKIRGAVAGATTTSSPLQYTSSVALPAATTTVLFPNTGIPDGFEIDSNGGTNTYGVTITHPQWVTGSVVATFDISIIGYEY